MLPPLGYFAFFGAVGSIDNLRPSFESLLSHIIFASPRHFICSRRLNSNKNPALVERESHQGASIDLNYSA
jgi:hypothetical protein